MQAQDITRIESEAGVISTLVYHPEFSFYSENLLPNHFFNKENRYIYLAITTLAQRGISRVDPYSILEALKSSEATAMYADELSIQQLHDFIEHSEMLARHTVSDYQLCVDNVLQSAFRRDTFQILKRCEAMCFNEAITDIETQIYKALDDVVMEFSSANEVPPYSELVDDCWEEIQNRQGDGGARIKFKFPTLNEYVTIERGELVIFGAEQKQGKSMLLLNCAVDLLKQDQAVLYLDSELNTRLFTARILSHLSGVEYRRIVSGQYSEDDLKKILEAKEWLKTKKFTHIYIPTFDKQSIYASAKKVAHTQGLDVLIVDYFKSSSDGDAFNTYQELGSLTDLIKNKICGGMNIAGIGAAQATAAGRLADSAKLARNASTIAMITSKTEEEIIRDGHQCGNKKLRVVFNRNGAQMTGEEYIDLKFNGNVISFEEAEQHCPMDSEPY